MNKKIVIIGIVALLVSAGLSGCNEISNPLNTDKSKFVGTWKALDGDASFVFFSDGTGSFVGIGAMWDIKDGKLVIIIPDWMGQQVYSYSFSNNYRTLTLTEINAGEKSVLIKQ